jgi:hypothetical protein
MPWSTPVTRVSDGTLSDHVWASWNTTATASTSANVVWTNWNNTTGATTLQVDRMFDHPRETEEERRRRWEQIAEQDRRWAEEARMRKEVRAQAEARANELLHSMLNDQQRETWRQRKFFAVDGSAGGHYIIKHGYQGNVEQVDDQGRRFAQLCIHPRMHTEGGELPVTDAVIAQLLTLTTDEPEFRRIANITRYALAA